MAEKKIDISTCGRITRVTKGKSFSVFAGDGKIIWKLSHDGKFSSTLAYLAARLVSTPITNLQPTDQIINWKHFWRMRKLHRRLS